MAVDELSSLISYSSSAAYLPDSQSNIQHVASIIVALNVATLRALRDGWYGSPQIIGNCYESYKCILGNEEADLLDWTIEDGGIWFYSHVREYVGGKNYEQIMGLLTDTRTSKFYSHLIDIELKKYRAAQAHCTLVLKCNNLEIPEEYAYCGSYQSYVEEVIVTERERRIYLKETVLRARRLLSGIKVLAEEDNLESSVLEILKLKVLALQEHYSDATLTLFERPYDLFDQKRDDWWNSDIPKLSTKQNHNDYTVGWICALPKEQTAAIALLDEKHPDLTTPPHDHNAYTLGRLGKHNVVITCLPLGQVGNTSSAIVASHMISTFPLIKFGLMVGIGGGVPPKVRLGDVVVSVPAGGFGGVVQWDFGKAEQGEGFKRTGALNNPPKALLTALTKLVSTHQLAGSMIPKYLEEVKTNWPLLAEEYARPGFSDNVPLGTNHKVTKKNGDDGEIITRTCNSCGHIEHADKSPRNTRIHYGLIASGNQVIKDAAVRDAVNQRLGGNVLCFEMEAAGLMNDFPCIVIRGISDYADSHKNDNWQDYATIVAGAFAKELLSMLPVQEVDQMQAIRSVSYI